MKLTECFHKITEHIQKIQAVMMYIWKQHKSGIKTGILLKMCIWNIVSIVLEIFYKFLFVTENWNITWKVKRHESPPYHCRLNFLGTYSRRNATNKTSPECESRQTSWSLNLNKFKEEDVTRKVKLEKWYIWGIREKIGSWLKKTHQCFLDMLEK